MTSKKCGVKLEDMIVAQRDDSEVNSLRDQVESLKTNLSTTQQKFNRAETEFPPVRVELLVSKLWSRRHTAAYVKIKRKAKTVSGDLCYGRRIQIPRMHCFIYRGRLGAIKKDSFRNGVLLINLL